MAQLQGQCLGGLQQQGREWLLMRGGKRRAKSQRPVKVWAQQQPQLQQLLEQWQSPRPHQ